MKTGYFSFALILCVGAFAQSNNIARWNGFAGVITVPGLDNPVGQIHAGAGPWTARSGNARVNLTNGEGAFSVDGLVMNGGNSSGTPGAVASVIGTLVCNVGSTTPGSAETDIDTPATTLSPAGDADLSFRINVPATCNNPLFLIRVPSGRWIATGTKAVTESNSKY